MRQQDDIGQFAQAGVDLHPAFIDVEASPRDLARAEHPGQGVLVDHLAARGVHHHGRGFEQFQPPRVHQVIGRGRMRTVDRDDIHPRDHLVEAFPEGGLMLFLDLGAQAAAVVIVDLHAEGPRPPGHGLPDAPHAEDAQTLAADPPPQKRHGRPARPFARLHQRQPFGDAARDAKDQRHGHVGGILGHNAGGVRHKDAALAGGGHVDVIHARAVIGDQFQLVARLPQKARVDLVGDRGHQHIGPAHGGGEFVARHRRVGIAQVDIEEFLHPGFHRLGQPSRHDNTQASCGHRPPPCTSKSVP